MPQNERLSAEWRRMLGENWKEVRKTWLHRLGNLTLTGYNSKYSDRPFQIKKTIAGGFADSSVRLNKFVREQRAWTAKEMSARTEASRSGPLKSGPRSLFNSPCLMRPTASKCRNSAGRRDIGTVKMSAESKALFEQLRAQVRALDSDVLEIAEAKSVSYHSPEFFLEVIPRPNLYHSRGLPEVPRACKAHPGRNHSAHRHH